MKSKNITNLKFNKLTAIKIVEKPDYIKSKQRSSWWICKCDCGNEKIVRSTELLRGDTKSCGCGNKYENSWRYKGVGKLAQGKFSHIKYNAIRRNLEFSISIEYAWELFLKQKGKCFYTNLDIELKTRNSGHMTASLDRIDSSLGYIEGNVVWVHKHINIMKNEYSHNYFLQLCNLIVVNHGSFEANIKKTNT
jgi:hypothetical protein